MRLSAVLLLAALSCAAAVLHVRPMRSPPACARVVRCSTTLLAPLDAQKGRREALQAGLRLWSLGAGVGAAAVVGSQARAVRRSTAPCVDCADDPLAGQLRSATSTEARSERERLEAGWQRLRDERPGGRRTSEAFGTVLRVRLAIDAAETAARTRRLEDIGAILPARLLRELEAAADVLARSASLSAEAREAVGWQWGACGWRRCGAQADASQSLSKLRANLGMLVPAEALFYLDIAKRAVDEILQLGVAEGLVDASALPSSEYLPKETLQLFLVEDDEEHPFLMPERKAAEVTEEQVEDAERELLREAGLLGDYGT